MVAYEKSHKRQKWCLNTWEMETDELISSLASSFFGVIFQMGKQ